MKYHGVMFKTKHNSNIYLLTWLERAEKYFCTGITIDPKGSYRDTIEVENFFDTNRWIKVCDLKEVMSKYYVED